MYAAALLSPRRLHVALDSPLPSALGVGAGTAVFVCGTCFSPDASITALQLSVNGRAQALMAHGMPRLDFFGALHPRLDPFATAELDQDAESADDPHLLAYRSGFWGIAELPASDGGGARADGGHGDADAEHRLNIVAGFDDGSRTCAELGRIAPAPAPEPIPARWRQDAVGPRVAICMATYNPPPDLLARQLESIRGQTHRNWICVISDDASRPEAVAALQEEISGDPRFVLSRAPRRLGFYRNFERALMLAPADADFVAMADQDDSWHEDKLEALLDGLGSAQLVYSDARIVSRAGRVLSDTYWTRRRNNHTDLTSLLVANSVTGAASLFRRELLADALPFPPHQFAEYHDHWIALTALCLGEIAYVDRPLYDYVQHGAASLGHAAANRMTALGTRLLRPRPLRERVRMWRLHYFVDACRLLLLARILILRCQDRMPVAKRRALERFVAAERSTTALTALAVRGARELLGTPETLGAEWMLFHAFAWRRLLDATVRERPQRRVRFDAVPPPSLTMPAGAQAPPAPVAAIADKIAPLDLDVDDGVAARINLLIPTIDLEHFFGGYIGKFNLARKLAERGLRVRVVTVDPVTALPPSWKQTIESYAGLSGVFEAVEVAFGRGGPPLPVSPRDTFVATTWWTAHVAGAAARALGQARFGYLIQEYEPFTFPMGSYAALAAESYRLPHFALFSSELLRQYFKRHAIGVYAAGAEAGDRNSASFQNAITDVSPLSAAELDGRTPRRLLFYARPEPHATRNMFELGVLALARAVREGAFSGEWELHGIGALGTGDRIELDAGTELRLLPRADQRRYAAALRGHDVGLALMYTPHPSLVPIEMAAAGMLTVTNRFENKTPEALQAISANLLVAEPSIDSIADCLRRAAAGACDVQRRLAGSAVNWSRSWDQSLPDQLLGWLEEMIGA